MNNHIIILNGSDIMENISLIFGKRLKNLRTSKKLSQEKLAELSGLHSTYIGQIERGEKSPTIESIYKISIGLDISLSDFFKNIDSKTSEKRYADEIYNEILSLSAKKQKKINNIIKEIITF